QLPKWLIGYWCRDRCGPADPGATAYGAYRRDQRAWPTSARVCPRRQDRRGPADHWVCWEYHADVRSALLLRASNHPPHRQRSRLSRPRCARGWNATELGGIHGEWGSFTGATLTQQRRDGSLSHPALRRMFSVSYRRCHLRMITARPLQDAHDYILLYLIALETLATCRRWVEIAASGEGPGGALPQSPPRTPHVPAS